MWTKKRIRSEAQRFAVWRATKMSKGQATIAEIAEATGVPFNTVRYYLYEKRWPYVTEEREARVKATDGGFK